jgi:hypothetical protein
MHACSYCAQDNIILEPMLQVLSGVNQGGPQFKIDYDAPFDPYTLLPADNHVMIYLGMYSVLSSTLTVCTAVCMMIMMMSL